MTALDELFQQLTRSDDSLSEKTAQDIISLYALQPDEVLQGVDLLLNNSLADARWWALRILAEIPGEQAFSRLLAGLQDKEAEVRQCAALGLREHAHARALPALIAALEDGDNLVIQLARDALVAIGKDATPALLELLEHGAQPVRLQAVRALAMIGDERAIPALFNQLDGNSCWMEYWASSGLERMGIGMSFFLPE